MAQAIPSGFDPAIQALSDIHRRRLLVALLEQNPQEDSVQVPEDVHVGKDDLDLIQMKMFHTHLPRLEERGFIEWDLADHEVARGPKFDEIRPLLELIDDHRDELPDGWV